MYSYSKFKAKKMNKEELDMLENKINQDLYASQLLKSKQGSLPSISTLH